MVNITHTKNFKNLLILFYFSTLTILYSPNHFQISLINMQIDRKCIPKATGLFLLALLYNTTHNLNKMYAHI